MAGPGPSQQPEVLAALLARCGLGDQRALAELYQATSAKLFGVALRICRREDWAEEVLQESFVNIWNHAAAYATGKSQPMTWMTSIVRNRALDWLRRPQHEQTSADYDLLAGNLRDDAAGPLEQLTQATEAAALARCLGELDGQQRQSIALAFQHGMSHSELAAHLKQPLGTIKTWIRRGLERLKGCLAGAGI
ncbi:MAG: sigma-70 family RNA polymerase sigma factor [Betaproteobacteria bacterium]|nr:sigma-70 family RNA polymerase sigma factor [Betaproteobacteria bacterium]